MPIIRVTLSQEQYKYIEKIAEAANVDGGEVIRTLVDMEMKRPKQIPVLHKTGDKMPAHAMSILTPEDDRTIYQLRAQGQTWRAVMQLIQDRHPNDNISYGAVQRGFYRAARQGNV